MLFISGLHVSRVCLRKRKTGLYEDFLVFRLVLLLNVGDKDKGKVSLSPQNIPWGIATRDAHSMQDFVR